MKFISHRGNLNGPNEKKENNPNYIIQALNLGFDVEIDVWYKKEKWYLGHDEPMYGPIEESFLKNQKIWWHCKNPLALYNLLQKKVNCFWHTNELHVLTSQNHIWTLVNEELIPSSICVLPEKGYKGDIKKCYGICSDFIIKYKNLFNE